MFLLCLTSLVDFLFSVKRLKSTLFIAFYPRASLSRPLENYATLLHSTWPEYLTFELIILISFAMGSNLSWTTHRFPETLLLELSGNSLAMGLINK